MSCDGHCLHVNIIKPTPRYILSNIVSHNSSCRCVCKSYVIAYVMNSKANNRIGFFFFMQHFVVFNLIIISNKNLLIWYDNINSKSVGFSLNSSPTSENTSYNNVQHHNLTLGQMWMLQLPVYIFSFMRHVYTCYRIIV